MIPLSVPPSPRLLSVADLGLLHDPPCFHHIPESTICELVLLGVDGDGEHRTALVAVYLETDEVQVHWAAEMDLQTFMESLPAWTLLNIPDGVGEDEPSSRSATGHRLPRRQRRRGPLSRGAALASSWRRKGRPIRRTEQFLIDAIEYVPNESAVQYLEAVRCLGRRRFTRDTRTLIADVCDAIAANQTQSPEVGGGDLGAPRRGRSS